MSDQTRSAPIVSRPRTIVSTVASLERHPGEDRGCAEGNAGSDHDQHGEAVLAGAR
jgi:hypothetical protein